MGVYHCGRYIYMYINIYNSITLDSNREIIMEQYGKSRLMNVRYCLSKYCRNRQLCQLLVNLCSLLLHYILIICKLLLF